MNNKKKGISFFVLIITLIIGRKLLLHFDFETFTFENPLLDMVYLITFIVMIIFIVKVYIERKKQK